MNVEENDDGYLIKADLREMNLSKADLRGADLTDANLSGANFKKADLSRVIFDRSIFSPTTRLAGADLQWAHFESAKELM